MSGVRSVCTAPSRNVTSSVDWVLPLPGLRAGLARAATEKIRRPITFAMNESPAMRRDWFAVIVIVVEIAIGLSAAALLYRAWSIG